MTTVAVGPIVAEVAGEGFPVVMIHGLGATSNMFQPLVGALANFRLVRLDMPGAGRSPRPVERLSMEGMVDATQRALIAVGVARAHLVGHSMGTIVCQMLAANRPELVASLTLFGALAEPAAATREAVLNRARLARAGGMADIADQIISHALSAHTRETAPAAVAYVREVRDAPGPGILRPELRGVVEREGCRCAPDFRAGPAHHRGGRRCESAERRAGALRPDQGRRIFPARPLRALGDR